MNDSIVPSPILQRSALHRIGNAGFILGMIIVGGIAVAALIGNSLVPHDPFTQDLGKRLSPPFWMPGNRDEHLLGTDQLGRDYLARLVYGARISLLIGLTTVITSGIIGTTLGVLGGYFGGRVDDAVLFAITCRLSIPVVLVALAVVGLLGSSLVLVVLTLGLLLWDRFAVVARSTTRTCSFARSCPTSPRISLWWRRWRWHSPFCWKLRCRSSASACRRRCRRGD
jgi:peptide/nickel transport system permease protein